MELPLSTTNPPTRYRPPVSATPKAPNIKNLESNRFSLIEDVSGGEKHSQKKLRYALKTEENTQFSGSGDEKQESNNDGLKS